MEKVDISAEQRRRNELSRAAWNRFAGHRQRVTALLLDVAKNPQSCLCLLGAGNCNDIDLVALLSRYSEIVLVDIDENALKSGVTQQGVETDPRIQLLQADVTGVTSQLAECASSDADITGLLCAIKVASPEISGYPFDVVASVCLLTQLVDSVVMIFGEKHPRFAEVALAIRNRHLHLLLELLDPGGTALLITDVVSSDSFPLLPAILDGDLPRTIHRLIAENNFFTGANPFTIRNYCETDPQVAALCSSIRMARPWLWDFGPRVYAVCAVAAQRRERVAGRPSA